MAVMMSLNFSFTALMWSCGPLMTLFLRPMTRLLPLMTLLLSLMSLQTAVLGTQQGKTQFCSREVFDVKCRPGHVILMKSASYGRMRSGLCIGSVSLGCTNDVLPFMDTVCSGRSHCRLEVNDLEKVTQPCSRDFKSYLEAEYECVPVISSDECSRDSIVIRGMHGYILGNATSFRGLGMHHHCSYTINVKQGQHINIYLHNFALHPSKIGPVWSHPRSSHTSAMQSSSLSCSGFLTVEDHTSKKRIDLCADVFPERRNLIFTSQSNTVSLHHTVRPSHDAPPVLISYQAWGCPDLESPSFGWVERRGHDAIVRCNTSGDVWYLTCKDNAWIGEYGNCTSGAVFQPQDDLFGDGIPFQQAGLALAVGVGVIVGTILGAILLVCVYTIRKGRREAAAAEARAKQHNNSFPRYVDEERLHYPSLLQGGDKAADPSLFEYTHVWDSRVQCLEKKPPTCKPSASPFSGASVTIETPLPAAGGPSGPPIGTRVTFDPTQRKLHIYDTSPPRSEDPNKRSRISSDIPMYFDLDPDSKFELEKMGTLKKMDI